MEVAIAYRFLLCLRLAFPGLLLVAVFHYRSPLVELLSRLSGNLRFIDWAALLIATAEARLVVWAVTAAALLLLWRVVAGRLAEPARAGVYAALVAVLMLAAFLPLRGLQMVLAATTLTAALLWANLRQPEHWRARFAAPGGQRITAALFWFLPGIEYLVPVPVILWLRGRAADPAPVWRLLPALVIAAAVVAALVPRSMAMTLGARLFMSPAAHFVFGPDFDFYTSADTSDLAYDPVSGTLFICGDGQTTVTALDVASDSVHDTGVDIGDNQFCAIDPSRRLLLSAEQRHRVAVLAPLDDLADTRRVPLPTLPDGEVFVVPLPKTGRLVAASENLTRGTGADSVYLIDLATARVVARHAIDVGYVIADPEERRLFVSHYERDEGVDVYDIETGALLATTPPVGRADRMVIDAARGELLVTVPLDGLIRRFDLQTLAEREPIATIKGARALAIDAGRDLLIVAGLMTDRVDVIDLKTRRSLRRYWVGPWLRNIDIADETGSAYIASRFGVYRLDYLQ
ncbi:MAG: hypothetical protein KDD88_10645 [Rhodobacteraceae bacterium]|nr:hypothetical protein [Paracoccaceae bacterium]